MDKNLDGYELVSGMTTGDLGIKLFVRAGHPMSAEERTAAYDAVLAVKAAVDYETVRIDPAVHAAAAQRRADILDLFRSLVYVEEIPNGYCSQACCAFYPWFVVTTVRGRIKIGWRKSVLHLEWTDSAVSGTAAEIFPKEEAWPGYETTQFDKVIHAHGYVDARNYIERILAWEKPV